jgi:hypothetical protein
MPVTNKYDFRPAMLYACTTESLIPWEWISESRNSGPFMSERERADLLLNAVNGDWLRVREWARFCGAPLSNLKFQISVEGSSWDDQKVPLVDQARDPLRATLEAVMREPETAIPIEKSAAAITDGRVIRITEVSEHGVPRDRIIAHSIGPALIFALGLILDPDKPYRRLLRQCAMCKRFAFGPPPETRGQPPNYYCSDEHRDTHRRQQNRERQAARRAGLGVERFRKRKIRSTKP